jgi:antitoxin VapB
MSDKQERYSAMKTAKLFQNGQSQAVRLPKEFRFSGDKVFVRKMGRAVVIFPCKNPWQTLFDNLTEFSDDFMENRVQPTQQQRGEKLFV